MNGQEAFSSRPSPIESNPNPADPHAMERGALVRAVERMQSQLQRLECQLYKAESHIHLLASQLTRNHDDLLKLLMRCLERFDGVDARLDSQRRRQPNEAVRKLLDEYDEKLWADLCRAAESSPRRQALREGAANPG